MKTILAALLLTITGCTTPCPPKPERYTCPDNLGTTWLAQDANGCMSMRWTTGGKLCTSDTRGPRS